jgi:hypothetical protein
MQTRCCFRKKRHNCQGNLNSKTKNKMFKHIFNWIAFSNNVLPHYFKVFRLFYLPIRPTKVFIRALFKIFKFEIRQWPNEMKPIKTLTCTSCLISRSFLHLTLFLVISKSFHSPIQRNISAFK